SSVESHTFHYGKIKHPVSEEIADEVMVSVMKAPKTFTCENVVEINCHGGFVSVNRILEFVLEKGARLAEPGEVTKRAILNGRIDISQAETVMNDIESTARQAMNMA